MCCFPFLYTISQSLLFPSKKLLPVIRICRIQCCRRVIACHTVLGHEGGDVGIRVFVEQAVVSHAETDYHVQVGMCFVQQTGLQNRVAALLPFIKAIVDVVLRSKKTIESVISEYSKVNMSIDKEPWVRILWEPKTQTMIMINPKFAWELLIYMYDDKLLKKSELNDLIKKYAGGKDIELEDVEKKLKQLLE